MVLTCSNNEVREQHAQQLGRLHPGVGIRARRLLRVASRNSRQSLIRARPAFREVVSIDAAAPQLTSEPKAGALASTGRFTESGPDPFIWPGWGGLKWPGFVAEGLVARRLKVAAAIAASSIALPSTSPWPGHMAPASAPGADSAPASARSARSCAIPTGGRAPVKSSHARAYRSSSSRSPPPA